MVLFRDAKRGRFPSPLLVPAAPPAARLFPTTGSSEVITVITCDGRNLVGNLRGFDQTTNLILDECHERVFSPSAGVEQVVLGLYIIRGDNM